jgi:serine phosphatase RsbU (regulator of sigma subunit)
MKLKCKLIIIFFLGLFIQHGYSANVDSLESLTSSKYPDDSTKFMVLMQLNDEFFFKDFNRCLGYLKQAYPITKIENNIDNEAYVLSEIGIIYSYQGKNDTALKYLDDAIEIAKQSSDSLSLSRYFNNKAYVLKNTGRTEEAVTYYLKSLKIKENIGDLKLLSTAYLNIGYVYYQDVSLEKGMYYYRKAMSCSKEIGDKGGMAIILNNMAFGYKKMNKIDSAKIMFLQALTYAEEVENYSSMAKVYNNLANISIDYEKDYKTGEDYLLKALTINTKLDDKESMAINNQRLALLALTLGKKAEAIKFAHNSLILARLSQNKETIKSSYYTLYEVNEKTGNLKEAFDYFKKYAALKDSIINESKIKAITEMEAKYQNEKKQLEIENLNKTNELSELKINQQELINKKKTQQLYGGGALIIILLSLIIFVYKSYLTKKLDNEIIKKQKEEVEIQKLIVEEKQHEIIDSITYAKRLQEAILPSIEQIRLHLPDSMVFYRPRDIVAGDFYWMEWVAPTDNKGDEIVYFAAADCTGHGVPGAMVSVVCSNALTRTLKEFRVTSPEKILDKVRELVVETFSRNNTEVKDGMDISLCRLGNVISSGSETYRELQWAGANNPLWIITKNDEGVTELVEVKPDKQPVGRFEYHQPFKLHTMKLKKNDVIYMFSDGYQDQFGGDKGKKYKTTNLKQLITKIAHQPFEQQQEILQKEFNEWKGDMEQIDDVCIIGVRL